MSCWKIFINKYVITYSLFLNCYLFKTKITEYVLYARHFLQTEKQINFRQLERKQICNI